MPKRSRSASGKSNSADVETSGRSKKRASSSAAAAVEDGDMLSATISELIGDITNKLESEVQESHGKVKSPILEDEAAEESDCGDGYARFVGKPVPREEAMKRWPHRYNKNEKELTQAKRHFLQAEVDDYIYSLGDDASVKAEAGKENYVCKIIEFFQGVDGSDNFTAQWYYRTEDTVIKNCCSALDDKKRVFFSEVKDDNPLDCLVKKLRIVQIPPKVSMKVLEKTKLNYDFYFDRMYLLPYASFVNLSSDGTTNSDDSGSTISSDVEGAIVGDSEPSNCKSGVTLLDLYSGCGAMSTGLCLGANMGGVNLVTKWAVDINQYACESLKLNHPETQVRNESAEDFLLLLKEWEKLCASHLSNENTVSSSEKGKSIGSEENDNGEETNSDDDDSEVYEVDTILGICYGDPNSVKKPGLHFKIRWKGYGPEEDTWEPYDSLSNCQEKLKDFVSSGHASKILPLPGSVDVICGGPPCQGISGFNRFRNKEDPLADPKNKQLDVFMNIVAYLKPRFVLMENVVDIVKFSGGFLGRYALGRLVAMGYQARMGMMAAGAYGLPQFRMRMFMWGALSSERLPQYPLPTHSVVVRGVIPTEFESNTVAYEQGDEVCLKKELCLVDAISDLPPVENCEHRDEMPYDSEPQTEFQRFIRMRRDEMPGCVVSKVSVHALYDHRPLILNNDDYERACHIPKKKGANFRDLPGVRVRPDNKVEWDPDVERVKVSSGKPLVPDYAMTFVNGTSSKPFARLWWDEIVPTVVTRAEPHNQAILHPTQDRVLTIRENARLQGFPDYYKLIGPIKERYIQVGNAVAVPVSRALGYSLALALKGLSGDGPLLQLPDDFPTTSSRVASPDVVD